MSSPTAIAPQFQTGTLVSNLDRCNWCGQPRSSHGADRTCRAARPGRVPKFVLPLGLLLALTGGILASNTTGMHATVGNAERSSLGIICLLVGITLAVAALIQIRRQASSSGSRQSR